jgi:hypothetical protein
VWNSLATVRANGPYDDFILLEHLIYAKCNATFANAHERNLR